MSGWELCREATNAAGACSTTLRRFFFFFFFSMKVYAVNIARIHKIAG